MIRQYMNKTLPTLWLVTLFFMGCATQKNIEQSPINNVYPKEQRIKQLKELQQWQINGKLGFIQKKKRQSATLFWQYDQASQAQTLKLNTYLGINVLALHSKNNFHTVTVDGQTYQSDDLDHLIYSLTELTLPTRAMHSWLKGLAFLPSDRISYHEDSKLPTALVSHYNGQEWHITYSDYQQVNAHQLAKKITLKQNDLTIKIMINQWTL